LPSPHTLELKKLPPVSPAEIKDAFGGDVAVFTLVEELTDAVLADNTGVHL
jgi:UDP-N-acetylmuramate: L-alanyl-gamma-D-glutamyl-meso-diaminopimelate ligase